jgi:hypothetical protein
LLSFLRLLEQSQLFFQWQLDPGFPYNNPDTIDPGLKLNFATGPNIVRIGNRFWERHLKLAGHPAHDPYSRKESFLVRSKVLRFFLACPNLEPAQLSPVHRIKDDSAHFVIRQLPCYNVSVSVQRFRAIAFPTQAKVL